MELQNKYKEACQDIYHLNSPKVDDFYKYLLNLAGFNDIRKYEYSICIFVDNNPYFIILDGGPDEDAKSLILSNKNIIGGIKILRQIFNKRLLITYFNENGNSIKNNIINEDNIDILVENMKMIY